MEEKIYNPKLYFDQELKNKSGIYQIRNIIDNKIYIGSSNNLSSRKYKHFYNLTKNNHPNKKLQNAFNKYGKNNFVFEIVEFIEDKNKLQNIEQYWIDKLDVVEIGYNINPVSDRGPSLWGIKNGASKRVLCLETLQLFESASQADREFGLARGQTSNVCRCESLTAKNLHFVYEKDFIKMSLDDIQNKINYTRGTPVVCLETKEVFSNIAKACNKYNCATSNIINSCITKITKTKGYHWMYYDEYKNTSDEEIYKILNYKSKTERKPIVCLENGIIYKSQTQAKKECNLSSHINEALNGKRKTCGGFHWMYLEDIIKIFTIFICIKLNINIFAIDIC